MATAIAGAAIGPAVAGMTLGIVRQAGFNRQNGRNQAFNHAGNMVGAALSGLLGWKFGLTAVFWLAAVFGVLSIISVLMIPAGAIDDREARGLKEGGDDGKASGFRVLLECKPLLILAAALACFHLGNGAMLPLYGLAVVADKQGDPASFVALTIVVAQAVMIVASVVAMRLAEKSGYWLVLLISFIALPIRGLVAAHLITYWGVYPVQMLDGVGAGLAKRRRSRPCSANPQRHRPRQCRPRRGHDGAGARGFAQSRARRLDRPGSGLPYDVHDPRQFRPGVDRPLGRLRLGSEARLRVEGAGHDVCVTAGELRTRKLGAPASLRTDRHVLNSAPSDACRKHDTINARRIVCVYLSAAWAGDRNRLDTTGLVVQSLLRPPSPSPISSRPSRHGSMIVRFAFAAILALAALSIAGPASAQQGTVKDKHGDWETRCETPPGGSYEQCAIVMSVVDRERPNLVSGGRRSQHRGPQGEDYAGDRAARRPCSSRRQPADRRPGCRPSRLPAMPRERMRGPTRDGRQAGRQAEIR